MTTIRFAVLDTETTGLDPETCEVCELAYTVVEYDTTTRKAVLGETFETYVNPGMPIPPEVSGIHHIIDEDVQDAPSVTDAFIAFGESLEEHGIDMLIAHNAEFDRAFVDRNTVFFRKWACTRRLAMKLWPDAPGYSNQTLRYWLKLEGIDRHGPVHRALFDTSVTARTFIRAIEAGALELQWDGVSENIPIDTQGLVARLAELSKAPVFVRKMPFGKHRGDKMQDIPGSYLRWLRGTDIDGDLLFTVKKEIDRRIQKYGALC